MIDKATLGAGCFWGVQAEFDNLKGVIQTTVGYAGGQFENPTYKDVCSGNTGHAEVLQIEFDNEIISYSELLDTFWNIHDPTTLNRQGPDFGSQYRSIILTHNEGQQTVAELGKKKLNEKGNYNSEIVTEIIPIKSFYKAEDYHQKYYIKNNWI